jgi:CRP-like cAMP-binding protein
VHCLALSRADFERMLAEQPELDAAVRELAEKRLQELRADT